MEDRAMKWVAVRWDESQCSAPTSEMLARHAACDDPSVYRYALPLDGWVASFGPDGWTLKESS